MLDHNAIKKATVENDFSPPDSDSVFISISPPSVGTIKISSFFFWWSKLIRPWNNMALKLGTLVTLINIKIAGGTYFVISTGKNILESSNYNVRVNITNLDYDFFSLCIHFFQILQKFRIIKSKIFYRV